MNTIRRMFSLISFSLAVLRHEWMSSLCLITTLAAVLCPVILLLGLKYGTVENLRQGLLKEPSNLEIRPRSSLVVDEKMLEKIRSFEGTAFIIPKTRTLGSASVELQVEDRRTDVDLIPTGKGDPLLELNHQNQPGNDGVVLTSSAAKILKVVNGDRLKMTLARRNELGAQESVSLSLIVRGTLPPETTTIRAAYVPLALLSAVEEYRENLAVPAMGWSGPKSQRADPIYDGFLWVPEVTVSAEFTERLSVLSGFLSHRSVQRGDLPDSPALESIVRNGILFYNENNPLPMASIKMAESLHSGHLYPWCKSREIRLLSRNGSSVLERIFTWPSIENIDSKPQILVDKRTNIDASISLAAGSPLGEIRIPCEVTTPPAPVAIGTISAFPCFMGILRHLDTRSVTWDPAAGYFLLGRRGFSSFRLYARDLSQVEALASRLSSMGIDCSSEGAKIARVIRFDQNLTKLFWLVGIFSLTGGAAALVLSLMGAIERRRRDHAMLRTLGLPRIWLFFLPLVEALFVATAAFGLAIVVYHINAAIINRLFNNLGQDGTSFCHLPVSLQISVYLWILLPTILGAFVAGIRMIRMPLSETIRHV